MAVREVRDRFIVELKPHIGFNTKIPYRFLLAESNSQRVVDLSKTFRASVNQLCRTRRNKNVFLLRRVQSLDIREA